MPTESDAWDEDCPGEAENMQALMAMEADELTTSSHSRLLWTRTWQTLW